MKLCTKNRVYLFLLTLGVVSSFSIVVSELSIEQPLIDTGNYSQTAVYSNSLVGFQCTFILKKTQSFYSESAHTTMMSLRVRRLTFSNLDFSDDLLQ